MERRVQWKLLARCGPGRKVRKDLTYRHTSPTINTPLLTWRRSGERYERWAAFARRLRRTWRICWQRLRLSRCSVIASSWCYSIWKRMSGTCWRRNLVFHRTSCSTSAIPTAAVDFSSLETGSSPVTDDFPKTLPCISSSILTSMNWRRSGRTEWREKWKSRSSFTGSWIAPFDHRNHQSGRILHPCKNYFMTYVKNWLTHFMG